MCSASLWEFARDQREVLALGGGVDDEEQAFVASRQPRRHQIVENAAGVVQQLSVARALGREFHEIGWSQRLQRPRGAGAGENGLAHVRNIEQPGLFAGVKMFRDDAGGVMQRHVIAGERDHARAETPVQRIERNPRGRGFGNCEIAQGALRNEDTVARKRFNRPRAPSVRDT